ncbi:MAG: response regulator [bacterium]|nr:response regulator [bacterium]
MKKGRKAILFFLTFLFMGLVFPASPNLYGQDNGFKYITNYSSKDYKRNIPQNWWVIQDDDGVIYVANNGTLLVFDGASWRYVDVPNQYVRSIAIDDADTIYVGGINEFGYLVPDEKGSLQYVSLSKKLKDEEKNFSEVWKTYTTKEGIYFQSKKILFRWDYKEITPWPTTRNSRFHFSYVCNGDFFIKQDTIGLMKMVNDKLELVPGGEIFKDKKIYMMVPYDSHRLLIGTKKNGFYIYDGTKTEQFSTEWDDYLKDKILYHGIRLASGDFALATQHGGLVIIDSQGHVKKLFTQTHGLADNDVKYVYEDSQKNLWLALNEGIAKIEYVSPLSFFDRKSNLSGQVLSVVKHRKKLYAGTSKGLLFHVPPKTLESTGKFQSVPKMLSGCWSLLSVADSLLAATSGGVFQIETKNNLKRKAVIIPSSYFLLRSQRERNRIWVGTGVGLVSLYLDAENGQWKEEFKFKEITQKVVGIVEDKKGNLWLGTPTEGVINVDFPGAVITPNPKVKRYQTSEGLPEGDANVFWAAGRTMFATKKGLYRFDESTQDFSPDDTLGKDFAGKPEGRSIFNIAEDNKNNIWFNSKSRNFQAEPRDGAFRIGINSKALSRIPPDQVNCIYPDPDGNIIWFASNDGLIRFDPTVEKNYTHDFSTFIRRVWIKGEPASFKGSNHLFPVIPHSDRNLRFEFAAPFFEEESRTRYRYLLEGYDDDWSPPTQETQKDYTNLDAGMYTFRVQATNIYQNKSRKASFKFKVLPPWYKTWWAFSIYAIGAFLLVVFIVRWRSGKIEREKNRLERIVKKRTKEIEEKNQQLEEQSEKLQEMDKVKSRFFANISHEFRTPLTLISGPIEQMISDKRNGEQKERLNLVLRNSHRLLTLINQLLDLSRFDSGKMKLQASPQNIIPFLKGILASFELAAAQKKINLVFSPEEENIILYFDAEKLEEVICNLLSNAFKFTPGKGTITVGVKKIAANEGASGDVNAVRFLDISISDTGIGISKDQLAHIFDRFYQAKGTSGELYTHARRGTGIGLALARESVTLHHGKIDVHSSKGKGTEFIVRLPMGKAHLKADEIVELSKIPRDDKAQGKISALSLLDQEENPEETAVAETNENNSEPEAQEKNVILVVEDNADVRQFVRGALEPLYTVKEAADGREGIQRAKEIIPDLIISDIMMPEADGYELCSKLKTDINTSHIPIVLLTAKASEENILEGLETGADDYITKPFNTKILCTRIKNLIDLRRNMQEKLQRQLILQPAEISVSSMDKTFIAEVQEAIEKNLSETEFNVERLGKKLYMSRATLYRKIQALTGESPRDFIRSYRLKRGAQLLKDNFGNVTEVAFEVGFSSTAYFTKCFKDKFHQKPHAFQTSHSN